MNFKPTKWKVIVSILAMVLWFVLNWLANTIIFTSCPESNLIPKCPTEYYKLLLLKPSCAFASCYSLIEVMLNNLLNIIIPFAIIYIIWSLIQKSRIKEKKK